MFWPYRIEDNTYLLCSRLLELVQVSCCRMKIQTVLGDISPDCLGITLTHEHFSLNFDKFYHSPPANLEKYFNDDANAKIHLKNVGFIRQYPYGSKFNINYEDEEAHQAVMEDVRIFKQFGGGAIVENTTTGINRNLKLMHEISSASKVHVIAGTGHYLGMTQKSDDLNLSVEDMVDSYMKEIVEGTEVQLCDSKVVRIKCGIIGEIGSAYPISDFERRSIMAAGEAQSSLKCGVTFHPGRDSPKSAFEVLRIYLEAGGDASKCVMSHLDRKSLTFNFINFNFSNSTRHNNGGRYAS
jgi:phosphotriesterase-related protein